MAGTCKHGNLMTPENTYTNPTNGYKKCKICHREHSSEWRARRAELGIVDPQRTRKALNDMLLNYNFPKIRFCRKGHGVIGDNIVVRSSRVHCKICLGANRIAAAANIANLGEGTIRRVLLALEEGKTLNNLGGRVNTRYVGGKIVDTWRLKLFCDANPKLGKHIKALAEKNRMRVQKQNGERWRLIAAPAILRNNGAGAFEAIQRACAHLWEGERGDVMSLMFIDASEGKLQLPDCTPEKAREYLKIHRRRPNVFGSYSLDTPIGEDSGMTWLDTKTDEDRLWA